MFKTFFPKIIPFFR